MHWDKSHAWEGDYQHAYMCIWNRGGDMRWHPRTFLIKMPPGQQKSFLGGWVFRVKDQQGSDSSLLPQANPWTALLWEVASRSQRARK